MSIINTGNVDITVEDKQINTKPSEKNDYNLINNQNIIEKNIKNNNNSPPQEDLEDSPSYYRFFIYSDTGLCIYKAKAKDQKLENNNELNDEELDNDDVDKDLGAI